MEENKEEKKTKVPMVALAAVALFVIACVPVGNATLLTYLVQLVGGVLNITPAFSPGTPFSTATIIASQPANITGSIVNNLGPVSKSLSVVLTPASGTIGYGPTSDITTMDLWVNGVQHTFLAGECTGGANLTCTTISPMALASGSNNIDVIPTPHMLFDPTQSPINVAVSVN